MSMKLIPRLFRYNTIIPLWHHNRHHHHHPRQLATTTTTLSNLFLPPTVFLGLGITLWAYKCLMMILFQNKTIYVPNIPPFSRLETVEEYAARCRPVRWIEDSLVTGDGVRLSVVVGDVKYPEEGHGEEEGEDVVVLYFQGNASSLPPRLPFLSHVLKIASRNTTATKAKKKNISLVAVSYRGFWTSTGRPSQKGIERDADAVLSWVLERFFSHPSSSPACPKKLLIWGQSIGAGVATNLTANYLNNPFSFYPRGREAVVAIPIKGLVLETPFTKIRDLLLAFYPQKWLPYRYLSPFLRSHWDSIHAMQRIAQAPEEKFHKKRKPPILMLEAGSDEVVPAGNAEQLEGCCKALELVEERKVIWNALHSNVLAKREGQLAIARFLRDDVDIP